jgi:hypothetical protein
MSGSSFDLDHDTDAAASKPAEEAAAPPPPGTAPPAGRSPAAPEPTAHEEPAVSDTSLDAARIEEIRERYALGAYDTADILTEVARRMLASGDV